MIKLVRAIVTFIALARALWVISGHLVQTNAEVKALSVEQNLAQLANAYGVFLAGTTKMGHIDPATGTTTQIINSLINNGFMN